MRKSYVCPHCGATEFYEYSEGGLVCAYCDSILETGTPSKEEDALRDMKEQANVYARNSRRWRKCLTFHSAAVLFTMLIAGLAMEFQFTSAGTLLILASGVYSFVVPAFLASKKPVNPMTSEKKRIVLNYFFSYVFLCMAYWGGILTSIFISAIIKRILVG